MSDKIDLLIDNPGSRSIVADLSICSDSDRSPIVLFCHGYKGFKDWGHFNLLPQYFTRAGFHFLKFNFSHNGGTVENPIDFPDLDAFSENNYSKEIHDIKKVIDWVCGNTNPYLEKIDLGRIYLMGHSRGGAMSIIAASTDSRIRKLITWSSIGDLAARFPNKQKLDEWREKGVIYVKNSRTKQDMPIKYQFYEDFEKNKELLDVKKAERSLEIPHLLIHGTNDETVHLGEALQLMSLNENTSLIKIANGTHTFGAFHPYKSTKLPVHAEMVVNYSIAFFRNQ